MAKKTKFRVRLLPLLFLIIPLLAIAFLLLGASSQEDYIYAKVRVSQGFWWASSAKPSYWFNDVVAAGDTEKNLLGVNEAEILEVKTYPAESNPEANLYNIYFTAKLKADYNKRTEKFHYNRTTLVAGAPLNLETSRGQISGTILDISLAPFEEEYVEKTVYLTKKAAYPWEYDAIRLGDTYHDGVREVFEVIDKSQSSVGRISEDVYGNLLPSSIDDARYISVIAKIVVQKDGQNLLFGEEKVLSPGSEILVTTNNFNFEDFYISRVE